MTLSLLVSSQKTAEGKQKENDIRKALYYIIGLENVFFLKRCPVKKLASYKSQFGTGDCLSY